MNPDIYKQYTGRDNEAVVCNLRLLVERGRGRICLCVYLLFPVIIPIKTGEKLGNWR